MLSLLNKKFIIKIPNKIKVIYCKFTHMLILVGSNGLVRKCKLKFKPIININSNQLFITDEFVNVQSKKQYKNSKSLRGLQLSLLKQFIKELTVLSYKRLNLIGVGYRAIVQSNNTILNLKLGYSHQIYIKIPETLKLVCPKPNIIFVSGSSLREINEMISLIRLFRIPEVYKGKGILYEYETINLKEGKNYTYLQRTGMAMKLAMIPILAKMVCATTSM